MTNHQALTNRESVAIDIIKSVAILSVISAHVVPLSNADLLSKIVSSFWNIFGEVGVITFFVIGGFLYNNGTKGISYWKKKFSRIGVPWIVCSALTYSVAVALGRELNAVSYLKWVLGSETWYYYITVYAFFLVIFRWFCSRNTALYAFVIIQTISLMMASCGKSTTLPVAFFTDYLNPLHWIGYFAFGLLIKKYRLDTLLQKRNTVILSALLTLVFFYILYSYEIFTYFHIVSSLFSVSAMVFLAAIAYRAAAFKSAKYIRKIGTCSYCIYLLHMQPLQALMSRIPDSIFKIILSPFIGLGIMLILISVGLWICSKIPFGNKVKSLFGL